MFTGRPVIGICDTWSELTPCNAHFREIAEWVKRGLWEAGGLPPLWCWARLDSRAFCQDFHSSAVFGPPLVNRTRRAGAIYPEIPPCGIEELRPSLPGRQPFREAVRTRHTVPGLTVEHAPKSENLVVSGNHSTKQKCPGWGSNPHVPLRTKDFKSLTPVSVSSSFSAKSVRLLEDDNS